ncbi:hypothetical protein ACFL5V_06680 [Fibrobacterota bacterium]
MEVIGIKPGDKILLIGEEGRQSIRCLPMNPEVQKKLPLESMNTFAIPCANQDYDELQFPWVCIDKQTRLKLGAEPWQAVLVGRDPGHVLAWELGGLAAAVALSAIGGAIVVPETIRQALPWLPLGIVLAGLATVILFTLIKIRSRI